MIFGLMSKITDRLMFVLFAAVVVLLPPAAHAAPDNERRVALVIGVGGYQNAPHLANPVNDARAIGDSLRRLKFDVTELYDPDFRALNVRRTGVRHPSRGCRCGAWSTMPATACRSTGRII